MPPVRKDSRATDTGSGKADAIIGKFLFELVVQGTPASRVLVTPLTRRAARTASPLGRAKRRGSDRRSAVPYDAASAALGPRRLDWEKARTTHALASD